MAATIEERVSASKLPDVGDSPRALVHVIETYKLEDPFLGYICESTFRDGSKAYLVEIFEPAPVESTDGFLWHGYPGIEMYTSVEEARAALPELLKGASEEKSNSTTFT